MDISHPHDSFFRLIVSKIERAAGLAQHCLPPSIARHILFETMTAKPDTFVDSQLQNRFSDALFSAQTRLGNPAYLYMLIDHKSTPDLDVPLQLLRYYNQIWERHLTNQPGSMLPPIIGVVFYHGIRPWNYGEDLKARFDCSEDFHPYLPLFRYVLIDLSTLELEQFQDSADLKAALMLMKYIFHPSLHDFLPAIVKVLKAGRKQPDFLSFFEAFMLYLLKYLNQEHHETVEKLVHTEFPEEGETIMPTVADKLREEGRQEGHQLFKKGLMKLLQAKFHGVPVLLQDSIMAVHDQSALEAFMDCAISADSLQQFEDGIKSILSR